MTKRDTSGGQNLSQSAFGALNMSGLPDAPPRPDAGGGAPARPAKHGKVHLRIEKSGRSGKTVTVLFGPGVERINEPAREELLKALKGSLGCGGAAEGATLELQGDVRARVSARMKELGWPVG